ncbi:hypothetical protein [Streptococcus infantis]|uniref:hypothetical protein n=1 Tax=Streptococcus infantis TaxID=68892 RepID=UPI0039C1C850
MLVYSAATAKSYSVYHKTKVMSTSQKEQLYRAFKKYAIEEFKRTEKLMSYNYDGRTKFFSRNVFNASFYSFYQSRYFRDTPLYDKLPTWLHFNTGKDVETICKRTITLIKAAGYKAEYNYKNGITMWKVKK